MTALAQLTPEKLANFPVQHFSFSAIRSYLQDRQSFFKRYVRLEYDTRKGPALVEGDLFHRVIASYYEQKMADPLSGFDLEAAFNRILEGMKTRGDFDNIDWGKTGSFDGSMKTVRQCLDFFFAEPEVVNQYDEILSIEEKFLTTITDLENNELPIPMKGFTDRLVRLDGGIVIEDWKTVSYFSNPDEVFAYELQASAFWLQVRMKYGENPTRARFYEIKKSKNREGGSQINIIEIEYTPQMIERFLELYRRVTLELAGFPLIDEESGIVRFLPNPFAQFGAAESWADFCFEVDTGKVWTLSEITPSKEQNRLAEENFAALDL